ncbi:hypothetical protein NX059_009250 [Plenodomus lindquistii]|nr:hypothetical protein NX059_009250 [Plenodomus lindquistii]
MSSPPPDSNAYARLTDPKPTVASKIPRSGRHSPFSTSASGSPRTENASPPPRNVTSPTVGSRLPRKSQTSTQLPTLRATKRGSSVSTARVSLPARGARTSTAMAAPAFTNHTEGSPASDRDKALPSPPMAQIVDPNSPPNAQRTLVDAESGNLSKNDYPVLRPEDSTGHSQKDNSLMRLTDVTAYSKTDDLIMSHEDILGHAMSSINHPNADSRSLQQTQTQTRSASDGAGPKEISNPYFVNRNFKSSAPAEVDAVWMTDSSQEHETIGRRKTMPTRVLGDKNPYAKSFHALTTGPDESLESPLARKKKAPAAITIPPRMSSMLESAPLATQAESDISSSPPPFDVRPVEFTTTESTAVTDGRSLEQKTEVADHIKEETTATQDNPLAHTAMTSDSEWSLDVESEVEIEVVMDNGTRIRRLCKQGPDVGPVLTIYPDAEAVLRGSSEHVPEIPSPDLPGRPVSKLGRERSLSSLTDKLTLSSKQSFGALNGLYNSQLKPLLSNTAVPDVPKISPAHGAALASTPIKPIRSMQPPRKITSAEVTPRASPSAIIIGDQPIKPLYEPMSPYSNADVSIAASRDDGVESPVTIKNDDMNASNVSRKAGEVLEIPQSRPTSAAVSVQHAPVKAVSPSFASSKTTVTNEAHKAVPMVSSDRHISNRNATIEPDVSGLGSSSRMDKVEPHDTAPSRGRPRLRSTRDVAPGRNDTRSTHAAPSSNPNSLGHSMASVGFAVGNEVDGPTVKEVKTKRSLRDRFLRRDDKPPELPTTTVRPKRSFMGDTKSNLAKRLSMKSMPKVHLSDTQTPVPELKSVLKRNSKSVMRPTADMLSEQVDRQAALSTLEASSANAPGRSSPKTNPETSKILTKLAKRVSEMQDGTDEKLRAIEILEALIQSAYSCNEAKKSAEKARMFAMESKINADRAELALKRLTYLCQSEIDAEADGPIREYLRMVNADRARSERET